MTLAECLASARALLADGTCRCALRALGIASAGHPDVEFAALAALDALTPDGWTFLLWADGAHDAIEAGEWVGVSYRYDRSKPEILALMGRAALRAQRQEAA